MNAAAVEVKPQQAEKQPVLVPAPEKSKGKPGPKAKKGNGDAFRYFLAKEGSHGGVPELGEEVKSESEAHRAASNCGRGALMDGQGRVTPEQVRASLRTLYRGDMEANLQKALFHVLRDDLKPVNDKGRWKANPLLVLVGFLLIAAFGVFLYFSRIGGGAG